jgi:arsenite methyltransferase
MKLQANLYIALLLGLALALTQQVDLGALQLGSRSAKEWIKRLESPERLAGLKADDILKVLDLEDGDIVADIGAGTGVLSRPMARAVAPTGRVLAVEVDQELLDYIDERSAQEELGNLVTVLGAFQDPKLPTNDVDVAFFHNTLHHIKDRVGYLKLLASHLKPDGRIVVIDMIDGHKDDPAMQIDVESVMGWMETAGFQRSQQIDLFEDKFFVVFQR